MSDTSRTPEEVFEHPMLEKLADAVELLDRVARQYINEENTESLLISNDALAIRKFMLYLEEQGLRIAEKGPYGWAPTSASLDMLLRRGLKP